MGSDIIKCLIHNILEARLPETTRPTIETFKGMYNRGINECSIEKIW